MSTRDLLRKNAVLRQLPEAEFERIEARADVFAAEPRQQVHEAGRPIPAVYFPLTSVYSLVAIADDRITIEVATIGHEGMVGLPLFLGAHSTPHAAFCQVEGHSARLSADDLRAVLTGDGALHRALNRLSQATMVQIAQNVVCNNSHDVGQRAARWLLTTQDRVQSDTFGLTQEFLSQMLGVRRPTVSQTAATLQARGLITYARGVVTVVDRAGLEGAACQCYQIVRAEFDAMTKGS